ncbi:hypothetical protein DLH72_03995 [Candidatus Gracilibacteria bacterium]|nr:MAG: hypothetical protein DLH72_03995 [Candidatus Gracilibacteria bacterium]
MKNKKMPAWLKKVKENQAEKSKIIGFERLKTRIGASADSHNPAIIMDLWEEVERLNFKEFEDLKNSLSEEGRDFLENIILK